MLSRVLQWNYCQGGIQCQSEEVGSWEGCEEGTEVSWLDKKAEGRGKGMSRRKMFLRSDGNQKLPQVP